MNPLPVQPFPGMGRIPLGELCKQYNLDQQQIISALAAKDINTDPDKSLKEIAGEHGTDLHALYALIYEAATRT